MPRKMTTPTTVREAVLGDLSGLGGGLERSGLALTALALADELDDDRNSATSKSMCAKALQDILDRLRELAPPKTVRGDAVADLAARRAARRGRPAS